MSYHLFKPTLIHNTSSSRYTPFLFYTKFLQKLFFPSVTIEWKNLDKSIRNAESLIIFKKSILKFIRPYPNSIFDCFNTKAIKHLTRLHLSLSHLSYHKFKHGFLDSLNQVCSGCSNIERNCHFLLHCPNFVNEGSLLPNNVSRLTKDKLPSCDTSVIKLLLYGDNLLDLLTNTLILNASIDFILSSIRPDGPLLYDYYNVVNNNLIKI